MKYTFAMYMPVGGKFRLPTSLLSRQPFDRCISCEAEREACANNRVKFKCGCEQVRTECGQFAIFSTCPYAMRALSDKRVRRIVRSVGPCSSVAPQNLSELRVGSQVRWVSQSAGKETIKRGSVVAIVPASARPESYIPEGMRKNSTNGYGKTRDHKSFLIQVSGKGSMVYWPRVYSLELLPSSN